MYKKVIKYTDFNGNKQEETAYFNLSPIEMTKLLAKTGDDIEGYTKKLVAMDDKTPLIDFFESLLLNAYGKKSEDGQHFVKTPEDRKNFENSMAYATLFGDILSDPKEAAKFGNGVVSGVTPKKKVSKKTLETDNVLQTSFPLGLDDK